LSYRPLNTLEISVEPEWYHMLNSMQYVETVTLDDLEQTHRYLFGTLDQKVLSMSLRIDYNITPDLTIQYWGQPFFASGRYTEFKRITDPEATAFTHRFHIFTTAQITASSPGEPYMVDENKDNTYDYTFDNPDFTVSEFLSNLVIRWEFMPGSTAYLVWSQTREYANNDGLFDLSSQFNDVFTQNKAYNIFLIKLSYRFGLR